MKYRIGCSGFYYPQWKNKLYPVGLPPKKWLTYYSSLFNTCELNGTFYRMPTVASLRAFYDATPPDFRFSVKMNKLITHMQRLKEQQSILDFQNLVTDGLKEKLNHFLFQMPPSFRYNETNLENIISRIPNRHQNVIEFRNLSWWNATVEQALHTANITFCNVDFPNLNSYFIHTTPVFYMRLHGSPDLFKSSYDKSRLEDFAEQFPREAQSCSVYFNNTIHEAGYQNAIELMNILGLYARQLQQQ